MKFPKSTLCLIGIAGLAALTGCSSAQGTLSIYANGEDFVRQGFVTKDGWQIDFDNVYVTLDQIQAYQSDPPFDPDSGDALYASETVTLDGPYTVDLAASASDPELVDSITAPAGRYNALSWELQSPVVLAGTATKGDEEVPFELSLEADLTSVCGDFIGDARKGILEAGGDADLEATFHFDHLFGDADLEASDSLNQGALGFAPFVAIAKDNAGTEPAALKQELAPADYQRLGKILTGLGHVGEGHCRAETES